MDPKELPEGVREAVGDQPTLMFTFERVLCPKHGEPFRKDWPSGYPVFLVKGWELVVGELGEMPKDLPTNQQIGWIELQLSEEPICCRLGPERYLSVATDSRKWHKAVCKHCKSFGPGSAFRLSDDQGRTVRELSHVCLSCVAFRARRHEEA